MQLTIASFLAAFVALFCLNVCWLAIPYSYQCTAPSRKNIYYCLSSLPDFGSLSYPLFALLLFSGAWFPSSCCIHFADPSCCSHSFFFPTPLCQASWWQRLLISAPISGHGSCFSGCAVCCFSSIAFGGVYLSFLRLQLPQHLHLTVAQIVACCTLFLWLLDSWSRPTPEHRLRLFCCNGGLPILLALSTVLHPMCHSCHELQETTSQVKKCCSCLYTRQFCYARRLSCDGLAWHASLSTPFAFVICCLAASTTDSIFPKIAVFKRDSIWSRGSQLVLISHVLQCPLIHCE